VRFVRESDQSTRVQVRASYVPPAGFVGNAVLAFFGADPKHLLDADLVRMTSLLEDGKTTGPKGQITLKDVTRS
jgi:uncharacterized membrane protein